MDSRLAVNRWIGTRTARACAGGGRAVCATLLACALLAGCASSSVLTESRELFDAGRGEEALAVLEKATRENPGDRAYRVEYFRQRDLLVTRWLAQAESMRLAGQFDTAAMLHRRVLAQDPANARAQQGLAQVESDIRHRTLVADAEKLVKAGKYRDAQDTLRPVLVEDPAHREARRLQRQIDEKTLKPAIATPRLRIASAKPVSLELRDVTVRAVFDVLARAANVNFVFDKDVRADQKTTIVVRDATIEDAIQLVLVANQLEQKILNERTALVFPSTPGKRREYQELAVKSFYLANADVKQTATMIRTILKTRDVFIDEKLNLVVIKDTPSNIRFAERLIAAQDLAEPEVMLELEVLEISSNRLLELGLKFPDSVAWSLVGGGTSTSTGTTSIGATTGTTTTTTTGTPGVVSLPEWLNRSSNLVRLTFTDPLFLLTLRQQDGTTSLLANPRIRVKNKEKAKILIGERVPVFTTTAAATGGFVSQSVSYLDVGLKLEVEPLIYLEDEVGIKVGLEVSTITGTVGNAASGTLAYQIGTRNASTSLRLRDGETQILAGLINKQDSRSANRVPGLGDLPIVGRLFSSTSDTNNKTEIVLLITPRLLRTLARPDAGTSEFAAGTEGSSVSLPVSVPEPPPPALVPVPAELPVEPAVPPAELPAAPAPPAGNTMTPFGGVQKPAE